VTDISSLYETKKSGRCLSPGKPSKDVVGVNGHQYKCFDRLWDCLEACWEVERWQRPGFFAISMLLKELQGTIGREG